MASAQFPSLPALLMLTVINNKKRGLYHYHCPGGVKVLRMWNIHPQETLLAVFQTTKVEKIVISYVTPKTPVWTIVKSLKFPGFIQIHVKKKATFYEACWRRVSEAD